MTLTKREWEIVEVHNGKAIPVFAEMACKLKDWSEYSYEDMLAYFESRFGLPEFKVYVETGNLYGLMAIQAIMPVTARDSSSSSVSRPMASTTDPSARCRITAAIASNPSPAISIERLLRSNSTLMVVISPMIFPSPHGVAVHQPLPFATR